MLGRGINPKLSWCLTCGFPRVSQDVKCYNKLSDFPLPIIADEDRKLAVQLGMIDPDERTDGGMPLTCRAVFIIGPDKKLKLSMLYPATTGRNFEWVEGGGGRG